MDKQKFFNYFMFDGQLPSGIETKLMEICCVATMFFSSVMEEIFSDQNKMPFGNKELVSLVVCSCPHKKLVLDLVTHVDNQ